MSMHELIELLEKATGPDRKIDVQIKLEITGAAKPYSDLLDSIGVRGSGWTPSEDEWPRYTSSIDAALALVPDRALAKIFVDHKGGEDFNAEVIWEAAPSYWINSTEGDSSHGAALALCIAALKARSQVMGRHA